jgi:hypothetical protein
MPVISALPGPKKLGRRKAVLLADSAEKQLTKYVLLALNHKSAGSGPMLVGLLSSYSGEGKSLIADAIMRQLRELGVRAELLVPRDHKQDLERHATSTYDPMKALTPGSVISELNNNSIKSVDVVIVVFPALMEQTYPVSLLQRLDMALVALRMGRHWREADKQLLEAIKRNTKTTVQVVLTNAREEVVKEYVSVQDQEAGNVFPGGEEKRKRSNAEYIVPEPL